jgi:hypothetical protein
MVEQSRKLLSGVTPAGMRPAQVLAQALSLLAHFEMQSSNAGHAGVLLHVVNWAQQF